MNQYKRYRTLTSTLLVATILTSIVCGVWEKVIDHTSSPFHPAATYHKSGKSPAGTGFQVIIEEKETEEEVGKRDIDFAATACNLVTRNQILGSFGFNKHFLNYQPAYSTHPERYLLYGVLLI